MRFFNGRLGQNRKVSDHTKAAFKVMKAVIDIRISDEKQKGNTSLKTQEQIGRAYCEREDWDVVDIREQEAVSASQTNVQRVADLLEYCKENKGKFDVYVVFKLDRFARSMEQHHWLRSELLKMGIVLRSATETINESPSGKLVEGVLAAVAEYDNSVRRERVKIAMQRRVEEGLWPFPSPLGYYRESIPNVKLTVSQIDKECSWAVVEVFNLYSTGAFTYRDVAQRMASKKVADRKGRIIKFSEQLVQKMLVNPFYIKIVVDSGDKWHKGQHEALIPMSLFEKCKQVMKVRSNNASKKHLFNHPDFPLRRFVSCFKCNRPLTSCWSRGQYGKRHAYYYCKTKTCEKYSKMIKRDDIHTGFYEYLSSIKPTDLLVTAFNKVFVKRYEQREREVRGTYLRIMDEVQEFEKERRWVIEKGKKGILSDDLVKEELDNLERKLTLTKNTLTETHEEHLDIKALLAEAEAFLRTFEKVWYASSLEAKQKYQRLIFPQGVVYNYPGFSNVEMSLYFKVIGQLAATEPTMVTPAGFEPAISWMKTRYPRPLDDGAL